MLFVTDLSGNSELINKFNNFEMYEELNGPFTLTFISYKHPDNPGHELITQEGFIEYDGYTFRIKQLRKQTTLTQVSCVSSYFDNGDMFKYDIYGGTHTLSEFLTYVLSGTGWTWTSTNIDVEESKLIPNFGQNNVILLMDQLKSEFGFEIGIGRNNQITVSNELGPDNDSQYRYGYNVMSLTESIDTTKLKTHIEGFGADNLHVTYTSPYADNPGIGIRHAEPIYDEEYDDSNALLEHIKSQLHDYPDSVVELDDAVLLGKELGERIWLIHERMGFEYQTRVLSRRIKIPASLSSVTLGTIKPQPRTVSDALATQQANINKNDKINRSRILQTNERIELAVERLDGNDAELLAAISIEADRITQEVTDRTNDVSVLSGRITVEADRITSEVSDRQAGDNNTMSYIDQTATSITSTVSSEVTRLDGRVDSSNSVISQNASEILLRVRKDGVISSINQTAESIRIQASKINLVGAVTFSDLDVGVATSVGAGLTAKARTDDWIDPLTTKIKGSSISTGDFSALNSIELGGWNHPPSSLVLHTGSLAGPSNISTFSNGGFPGMLISSSKLVIPSGTYVGVDFNATARVLTTADTVYAKFA